LPVAKFIVSGVVHYKLEISQGAFDVSEESLRC